MSEFDQTSSRTGEGTGSHSHFPRRPAGTALAELEEEMAQLMRVEILREGIGGWGGGGSLETTFLGGRGRKWL